MKNKPEEEGTEKSRKLEIEIKKGEEKGDEMWSKVKKVWMRIVSLLNGIIEMLYTIIKHIYI